jgi:hypothetical protein
VHEAGLHAEREVLEIIAVDAGLRHANLSKPQGRLSCSAQTTLQSKNWLGYEQSG